MTTDELRTWMRALEERDVRIVALEKRLAALEEAFAQPPRMKLPEQSDEDFREQLAEAFQLPGVSYVESYAPYRELQPCPLCAQPIDADSGLCPASCYHKRPAAYSEASRIQRLRARRLP
jgi:hypothetical protein